MKAAIFVEGHTEVQFVRRLILEIANKEEVSIIEEEIHGNAFSIKVSIAAARPKSEILIANCRSDGKVATAIRDRYSNLVGQGYDAIIGLRDLYPYDLSDLQTIKDDVSSILPSHPIPVSLIIAVKEVEAWFIEEYRHFEVLSPHLSEPNIKAATGYDILSGRAETIEHPAALLNQIYQVAGLAYHKKAKHVTRTVDAISFESLYLETRARSQSLDEFISVVDAVLH